MSNFEWKGKKRNLLSEIILSKMQGREPNIKVFSQDNSAPLQNKYSVKTDTWTDLLLASLDINPIIETSSSSAHPSGFKVFDDLGQVVLDKAFRKVLSELQIQSDIEVESLKEQIYNYIYENNLNKKGLYNLVKKLKILSLEDLQDLSK